MDENIEFLQDFLECDRYRIAELIDSVSVAMRQLGYLLHHHVEGPFTVVYRDENDPMYELIELLDGNNFKVEYGHRSSTFLMAAAEVTPLYMETIEVRYEQESEEEQTQSVTTYSEFDYEWTLDIPEVRNPSRRGLRAKMLLVDDALFDESLKPP